MTAAKKPKWQLNNERHYQKLLSDATNILKTMYSYDCSGLQVVTTVLVASKLGRFSANKETLALCDRDHPLITLELEDLGEDEQYQDFITFLGTIEDGFFLPIGTVLKLNQVEFANDLKESEISALTHAVSFLLMNSVELIVSEESMMKQQTITFQETWKDMYGFRSEKIVDYNGKRYWRSDAPTSWHF